MKVTEKAAIRNFSAVYKLAIVLIIFNASFSALHSKETPKANYKLEKESEIKRGPRGRTGRTGPQGPAGITPARIYANVRSLIAIGTNLSTTITISANSAVPFNNISSASGVDTSGLLSNRAIVIQTAGTYYITYTVVAGPRAFTGSPSVIGEIALLKNSVIIGSSRVRTRQAFTGSPTSFSITGIQGAVLLDLSVGDSIQLYNTGSTALTYPTQTTTFSDPLILASLTMQKIN